jgi:hypothetical protein
MGVISYNNWPVDTVHDFATGPKTYNDFYLNVTSPFNANGTTLASTEDLPGSENQRGFQTRMILNGTFKDGPSINMPPTFVNYYKTNTPLPTSYPVTRKKTQDLDTVWRGIFGSNYPYPFTINNVGTHYLAFYLFNFPNQKGDRLPQNYVTKFIKGWRVFQQAIPITRFGPSNTIIANNTQIANLSNLDASQNHQFNKGLNRGDEVASSWQILVQNNNNQYVTATPGVDYNLITGNLFNDTIIVQFLLGGSQSKNYRIINTASGYTSANNPWGPVIPYTHSLPEGQVDTGTILLTDNTVTNNTAQAIVNVNVTPNGTTTTVEDTIVLPTVNPVVTPVNAFNNTVVSLSPLTGIENFQVSVGPTLNTTSASFSRQTTVTVGNNPPTVTTVDMAANYTTNDWLNEIGNRCSIRCVVRIGNQIIQQYNGFGPHVFTLPAGNYNVGYEIRPLINYTDIVMLGPPDQLSF